VGKLQRVFKRIRFVRFFELSDPSEAKKSRKILLCALSFRTASVDSDPIVLQASNFASLDA
jgi:hypothetical protein